MSKKIINELTLNLFNSINSYNSSSDFTVWTTRVRKSLNELMEKKNSNNLNSFLQNYVTPIIDILDIFDKNRGPSVFVYVQDYIKITFADTPLPTSILQREIMRRLNDVANEIKETRFQINNDDPLWIAVQSQYSRNMFLGQDPFEANEIFGNYQSGIDIAIQQDARGIYYVNLYGYPSPVYVDSEEMIRTQQMHPVDINQMIEEKWENDSEEYHFEDEYEDDSDILNLDKIKPVDLKTIDIDLDSISDKNCMDIINIEEPLVRDYISENIQDNIILIQNSNKNILNIECMKRSFLLELCKTPNNLLFQYDVKEGKVMESNGYVLIYTSFGNILMGRGSLLTVLNDPENNTIIINNNPISKKDLVKASNILIRINKIEQDTFQLYEIFKCGGNKCLKNVFEVKEDNKQLESIYKLIDKLCSLFKTQSKTNNIQPLVEYLKTLKKRYDVILESILTMFKEESIKCLSKNENTELCKFILACLE